MHSQKTLIEYKKTDIFGDGVIEVLDDAVIVPGEGVETAIGRRVLFRVVPDVPFTQQPGGVAQFLQVLRKKRLVKGYAPGLGCRYGCALHTLKN